MKFILNEASYRLRALLISSFVLLVFLVGCGDDDGVTPTPVLRFEATVAAVSTGADIDEPVDILDDSPTGTIESAVLAGNMVLVTGEVMQATTMGTITFRVFLTFPLPSSSSLPVVLSFDDGAATNPLIVGRFDIIEPDARDEHESLPQASQPSGSGFIRIESIETNRIKGIFDFRAAVIEASGDRGEELLDVVGSFVVDLSVGEVSYMRNGLPVTPAP